MADAGALGGVMLLGLGLSAFYILSNLKTTSMESEPQDVTDSPNWVRFTFAYLVPKWEFLRPSGVGVLVAAAILAVTLFTSFTQMGSWAEAVVEYEDDACEALYYDWSMEGGSFGKDCYNQGVFRFHNGPDNLNNGETVTPLDMIAGYFFPGSVSVHFCDNSANCHRIEPTMGMIASEFPLGPDGPWLWLGFATATMCTIVIFGNATTRFVKHQKKLADAEHENMAIVRRLAHDPNGVIEGRIELPDPVTDSKRPDWLVQYSAVIILLTALLGAIMVISVLYEVIDSILSDTGVREDGLAQMFGLLTLTVAHIMACWLTVQFAFAFWSGEESDLIPPAYRSSTTEEEMDVDDEPSESLSTEPASFDDVLQALRRETEAARAEAEALRTELGETKVKVQTLEIELEEKNEELVDIQKLQTEVEQLVESSKDGEDGSRSIADSVVQGDALFGSSKINQQIINDPEAIARAVIAAYREGEGRDEKVEDPDEKVEDPDEKVDPFIF